MWDLEKLKKEYRKKVPPDLYDHNLRVMDIAANLAREFGADEQRAKVAGLVHDLAFPRNKELLQLAEIYGVEISPLERKAPILLHGPVGARQLPEVLGITDEEIINAVYWHTTGHAGATKLEKIVFLADKRDGMPEGNELQDVEEAIQVSLDRAVLVCVDQMIPRQIRQGFALHPDLIAMRNEIVLELD